MDRGASWLSPKGHKESNTTELLNTQSPKPLVRPFWKQFYTTSICCCCCCSVTKLCPTFSAPWIAAYQALLSSTISQSLLKFMSIESLILSNHLVLCHPLLLLPSVFPSIIVFSNETDLSIRWLKYWSFSFSISPSNEYSGLISFRIDWFDFLAVQGTLKSLL